MTMVRPEEVSTITQSADPASRVSVPNDYHDRYKTEARVAAGLLAIGMLITVLFGQRDPFGVIHADDLTHFLIAKWAWRWPAYLVNDWGRPGFTALYFFPAGIGWPACRAFSAVLSGASAWTAFCIARHLGLRSAWAIPLLCYVQPLFFKLSQTTLTETPLAFYLTLAIYLAQTKRWAGSAALVSLAAVTRHEAILFVPIWVYYAWRDGTPLWKMMPILWAPVLVNVLAPLAGQRSIFARMLDPSSSGQYGHGGWLTFFSRAMEAWGPGVAVLAMTGLGTLRGLRLGWMIVTCCAAYFGTHTMLRAIGWFDTGGYARFLVPLSPLVAICALAGWNQLWTRDSAAGRWAMVTAALSMVILWISMEKQLALYSARQDEIAEMPDVRHATTAVRLATGILVGLCAGTLLGSTATASRLQPLTPLATAALVILAMIASCRPVRAPAEIPIIRETIDWAFGHGLKNRQILSADVWVDYFTGRALPPDRPAVREQLAQAPIGTIFVWERQFAGSPDHGLPLEFFEGNPGYRRVYESAPTPRNHEPFLRLFEKVGPMY